MSSSSKTYPITGGSWHSSSAQQAIVGVKIGVELHPIEIIPIMDIQERRRRSGFFQPGNKWGIATRFKPGQPSPNPKGRPWGVNRWMRVLRSRGYDRTQLEDVLIDDHAPANQREAAVLLLLPFVERDPPFSMFGEPWQEFRETMEAMPTADLRQIVVDPRLNSDRDIRGAAYWVLVDRGILKPKLKKGDLT